MNTQNRHPKGLEGLPAQPSTENASGQRSKFPEPRAWALKWDTQGYDFMPTRSETSSTTEAEPTNGKGHWDKFPQPRGWALRWDGFTISAIQDFYNQTGPTETES
jgi:hypothetical protein